MLDSCLLIMGVRKPKNSGGSLGHHLCVSNLCVCVFWYHSRREYSLHAGMLELPLL